MVAIVGPSQYLSERPDNADYLQVNELDVDYLQVNELEPAEFYCKFIEHDVDHSKYAHRAYIDVINTAIHNSEREPNPLGESGPRTLPCNDCDFNVTNMVINSTNNMTIYKTQITFPSRINLDTSLLNIKCGVEYFPTGMASDGRETCISSSTFVILPNATSPNKILCSSSIMPTSTSSVPTVAPSPSSTLSPSSTPSPSSIPSSISSSTHPTPTASTIICTTPSLDIQSLCRESGYISSIEFAPAVAIMGLIIMLETILLIVCLFVKYKKSQGTSNAVGIVHVINNDGSNETMSRAEGTSAHAPKKDHVVPEDDDSTISMIIL